MQRQLLLLHGNAIKVGAQCISFIGNSGSGKSTLSGAFFKRGYSILADDICAINMEKLHSLQHHVYRKMYLSNQARKHLCFKQCMQLASIIEFVRIRRPIDGFTLDGMINKIKLDLMKRGFTENALTQ